MKKMYIQKYRLVHCIFFFILMAFMSCTDTVEEKRPTDEDMIQLSLDLTVPDVALATRTLTDSEKQIEVSKLKILVFEVLSDGSEEFRYEALKTKTAATTVTIKVPRGINNEKYRLVVLGNTDKATTLTVGDSKKKVLEQFTFELQGNWKSNPTDFKPIPMWGESNPTQFDRDRSLSILSNMAMARVDVGLDFKTTSQDDDTEAVEGLANFKLTSVRVYRTKSLAYTASRNEFLDAHNNLTRPNIPTVAQYNLADGTATADITVADKNPLLYNAIDMANPKGVDKLVRQIYIPESIDGASEASMDEVPCLVVGGYFGTENITSSTPVESFYRLNFAEYAADGKVKNFKDILRNQRYRFNIEAVTNAGLPTPEDALKALPAGIEVSVENWNEQLLNFNVQGDYHFGVEHRKVELVAADLAGAGLKPAKIPAGAEEFVWQRIAYKTNVPLKNYTLTELNGEWSDDPEKSHHFEVVIDENYIWFGAGPNIPDLSQSGSSTEGKDRKGELTISYMDFADVKIEVKQPMLNTIFNIDCASVKLNGKYREGGTLNYTHNIELNILVPTNLKNAGIAGAKDELYNLEGKPIVLFTPKRKGISFKFEGELTAEHRKTDPENINKKVPPKQITANGNTFLVQEYTLVMEGVGTPTKDPNDIDVADVMRPDMVMQPIRDLIIASSSIREFGNGAAGGKNCMVDIHFGYLSKKVLTIGSNARFRFGYELEPNTASRAFMDASNNFGIAPNSTVTMMQYPANYPEASARNNAFHIEMMTRGEGMDGYTLDKGPLASKLNTFKPDIIVIGYAIRVSDDAAEMLAKYTDNGGVLVMFSEFFPTSSSINNTVTKIVGANLNGSDKLLGINNIVFPLPGSETATNDAFKEDPILNGPFGDVRGKNWGSDGFSLYRFKNFTFGEDKAVVYSRLGNNGRDSEKEDVCFFRYKGIRNDGTNKPAAFVFNGDGGFISNNKRYIGGSYQGLDHYFPFAMDAGYRPIPRNTYRAVPDHDKNIYNSIIFANIMAWAVDYAEFNGINKSETPIVF